MNILKTFVTDIIDKISRHSIKLESASSISNKHWVLLNEQGKAKVTYFFRDNSELIIAVDGIVTNGTWTFLTQDSLVISTNEKAVLCRRSFFDMNILALKIDGHSGYAFFVNEDYYNRFYSIDLLSAFLRNEYMRLEDSIRLLPEKNSVNKYGYLDSERNIVIPYNFDQAYEFQEGTAVVANREYGELIYGIIDEEGKQLIPFLYEYALSFAEGLAVVKRNGKFGYVDISNVCIIDFKFDNANPFKDGRALVKIGGNEYYINKSGHYV
jgi:hypothetical protein